MKKDKYNLYKTLLEDDNVNLYTKVLIIISQYTFYDNFYMPNRLFMNKLDVDKKSVIRILNKMQRKGLISVRYYENKRYIKLINYNKQKKREIFDYDYLNEDEFFDM